MTMKLTSKTGAVEMGMETDDLIIQAELTAGEAKEGRDPDVVIDGDIPRTVLRPSSRSDD